MPQCNTLHNKRHAFILKELKVCVVVGGIYCYFASFLRGIVITNSRNILNGCESGTWPEERYVLKVAKHKLLLGTVKKHIYVLLSYHVTFV